MAAINRKKPAMIDPSPEAWWHPCASSFLPDPYLKAMADYFASEEPPFPPPATPR
jgi:hypothetical protein